MKKTTLILTILLSMVALTQAQNCFWAKSAGTSDEDAGKSIATDLNGNVYVTGYFTGNSISFGGNVLTNSNNGSYAYYVVKYSAGGNVIWARGAAGNGKGLGVATDAAGNIYVTGHFTSLTMTFGTAVVNSTAVNFDDIFVVKYNSAGTVQWAKSAGGTGYDYGYGIDVDAAGAIYITGEFTSSTFSFGNSTLTKSGIDYTDAFILKYSATGNPLWAKSAGGVRADNANRVSSHGAALYITGSYTSDNLSFGADVLTNDFPNGDAFYISKFDTSGTAQWTKDASYGLGIGYGITDDAAGNIYVTGVFHGDSIHFGSVSLHSIESGSEDIFIAKYSSAGNVIWAKGVGGSGSDISYGVSTDASNGLFITGYFMSPSINFEVDTLYNYGSNNPDVFIAKYDTDGNTAWVKQAGGTSMDWGQAVATGTGENVYFTGRFISSPAAFGNVTLNVVGYQDMFVADVYSFNSSIVSSTDVSCNGGNDGTAVTTASGGNQPYTYAWNTNPVETTASVTDLTAGTFSVVITEGYGCAQTSTVTIAQPNADISAICMVTVDSASQHNVIIWDKTPFTTVDSFIVYREIATNNYQPIARIPYAALSLFVDTVQTQYFPNTGNPNNGTYRYKIKMHENCGNYTPMSNYHNTIFLNNTNGVFFWQQLYTIENSANPVSSYVLMRDNFSDGNWVQVASVAGTQQTVSDPLFAVYQSTGSWRIETVWSISCEATLFHHSGDDRSNFSTSLSNIYGNTTVGVNENSLEKLIGVYPNPAENTVTIETKTASGNYQLHDVTGKLMLSGTVNAAKFNLDVSALSKGVYFLSLQTINGRTTRKIEVVK